MSIDPSSSATPSPQVPTVFPSRVQRFAEFIISDDGWKFIWRIFILLGMSAALIIIVWLFVRGGMNGGAIQLGEVGATQGLIAGVLLVTIVVLELVMIMAALFASDDSSTEKRINIARNVLSPLLAIFGTVIGFYFGTQVDVAKKGAASIVTAPASNAAETQSANVAKAARRTGAATTVEDLDK